MELIRNSSRLLRWNCYRDARLNGLATAEYACRMQYKKGVTFVRFRRAKEGNSLDNVSFFVYHQSNMKNAMTGKTSLRAFQRAVGCCETVCGQMIYWPLSSQLKVRQDRR